MSEPIRVFRNMEIRLVGKMVSTTIQLSDGTQVRILSDERSLVRQLLAYRAILHRLRQEDNDDLTLRDHSEEDV